MNKPAYKNIYTLSKNSGTKLIQIALLLFLFFVPSIANDLLIQDDAVDKTVEQVEQNTKELQENASEIYTDNIKNAKKDSTIKKLEEKIGKIIEVKKYTKQVKIHPVFTHFAISLPFAVFFISLITLLKYKTLSITDLILLCISGGVMYLAFTSGVNAHKIIINQPIALEAKNLLIEHKKIGLALLVFTIGLIVLRFILLIHKPNKLIAFYLFSFLVYLAFILYQGYIGINMVYDYGTGIYYDPLGSK